jgi:hypothetical protein
MPYAQLPADDPESVQQAVRRAEAGECVRLVAADGRRVADVIPPAAESPVVPDDERADRATEAFLAATGGQVTLEGIRRVYANLGQPYPGDDAATELYRVRPAS